MNERQREYQGYLHSDPWYDLKDECHERDGWRCRLCNSPYYLQAHHRRYPGRFGTETADDLTTLCANCHQWYSVFSGHAKQPTNLSASLALALVMLGMVAAAVLRELVR